VKSLATFLALAASTGIASADATSGVDGVLFRSAYDSNGIFSLEGARLLPKRDLSLRVLGGWAKSPLDLAVPGIGNDGSDRILDYVVTLDMAFGISLTDRLALGFSVGAYRTATGDGYGVRGRYQSGGTISEPSTGLIALRPLSNIDPSASPSDESAYLGDGLAGPLDARAGFKYMFVATPKMALTFVGSVFLPFGEDEMLLGDRDMVFEPKLAFEYRKDRIHATRFIANVGARFRERTVLEAYDPMDTTQTARDSQVILDVGSELVVGAGAMIELTPRIAAAIEAMALVPLPEGASLGTCRRFAGAQCTSIGDDDYFGDANRGDLTILATAGLQFRVSADVTWQIMAGTGQVGARGDDLRFTTGLVWAPQPLGAAGPGRNDADGDGVPNSVDGCPDETEDKDGFQDEDGCPDGDNDGDGIPDAADQCPDEPEDKDGFRDDDGCREQDNDGDSILDTADKCPDQAEDQDGFEDDDGCLDQDNDGDGFADAQDKCPNDAETVNGVDDDDGCPDVRITTGPEERADRIDLKGQQVSFNRNANTLTPAARQLLGQVATLIKNRKLSIRIEVHVPLGTKAKGAAAINARKRVDKQQAQARAKAIFDYLVTQGVAAQQLQAVGIGSARPLGTNTPTDPANERVDFIKSQQGGTP
jgi:outer membrane protein OmpA-like peptidoglycan-associated protein